MSRLLRLRARRTTLVVAASFVQIGAAFGAIATHGPPAPVTVRVAAAPVGKAAPPAAMPAAPAATPVPAPLTPAQLLAQRVEAAVAGTAACVAVRDGRKTVLAHGGTAPLTPASTQKMLVAAAAVSALGRDFRFVTKAVAQTAPQDGVVGALWLVGSGDPGLATPEYDAYLASKLRWRDVSTTSLAELADNIVASGVKTVGAIHGDESRYDTLRALPGWKPSYLADGEIGPLGALTVNEGFRMWTPRHERVDEPAVYAASELARLLAGRGVVVGPTVDSAVAPANATPLAEIASAPLAAVVSGMLRSSDNLVAELLTRELGRKDADDGSTAAGLAAVAARLRKLGIATTGLAMNDGSGLHTANAASCGTLVDAIDRGGVTDLLSVAGQSGTLINRKTFAGRLSAKTGWIDGVSGISGVLHAGRPLRFALLVNGASNYANGVAVQDAVLAALDAYGKESAAPAVKP